MMLSDQTAVFDADGRHAIVEAPRPRVAKPQGRNDVELGRVRPGVSNRHLDENVLWAGLGKVRGYLPVAITLENSRVEELVLRLAAGAPRVLIQQLRIWKLGLRIHVAPPHP